MHGLDGDGDIKPFLHFGENGYHSRTLPSCFWEGWHRLGDGVVLLFPMNTLYYGDNLKILRDHIKDESVDQAPLLFLGGVAAFRRRGGSPLDPPYNSNRNYNVLFKDESGTEADSQIHAFEVSEIQTNLDLLVYSLGFSSGCVNLSTLQPFFPCVSTDLHQL